MVGTRSYDFIVVVVVVPPFGGIGTRLVDSVLSSVSTIPAIVCVLPLDDTCMLIHATYTSADTTE